MDGTLKSRAMRAVGQILRAAHELAKVEEEIDAITKKPTKAPRPKRATAESRQKSKGENR